MTDTKAPLAHFLPDAAQPAGDLCTQCTAAMTLFKMYPRPIVVTGYMPEHDFIDYLLVEPSVEHKSEGKGDQKLDQGLVRIRHLNLSTYSWATKQRTLKMAIKSWPFFLSCIAHHANLDKILGNCKLQPWDAQGYSYNMEAIICAEMLKQREVDNMAVTAAVQAFEKADAEIAAKNEAKRKRAEARDARRAIKEKLLEADQPAKQAARAKLDEIRAEIEAKKLELADLKQAADDVISETLASTWCDRCNKLSGGGCDYCGAEMDCYESYVNNDKRLFCCKECTEIHYASEKMDSDKAWEYNHRYYSDIGCACDESSDEDV